jgi:hypothetical protein
VRAKCALIVDAQSIAARARDFVKYIFTALCLYPRDVMFDDQTC